MINKNKLIFFNTAHMMNYQGNWTTDVPVNGGSFIRQYGWGGEVFNFKHFEGLVYGYVEPGVTVPGGRQRNINISRLARPGERILGERISGVLVVWVARPPISDESVMVGWYENATVYKTCQHLMIDHSRILPNGSYEYFTSTKEQDCHLIPEKNRRIIIPRRVKGGLGHSDIWYANSIVGNGVKNQVIEEIGHLTSSGMC